MTDAPKPLPRQFKPLTHDEAMDKLHQGAKLTRHTYDPGTGLHECFLSIDDGEQLFVYRGTQRLEVPAHA